MDPINRLAKLAQEGDRDAFEQLARQLTPVLLGFFRRKGAPDPPELCQRAWERVVDNLDKYDADRDFRVWIFAIAYRLWVDDARSRAHVPAPLDVLLSLAESTAGDRRGSLAEAAEAIRQCLASLSESERAVMRARYWDQLDLAAVADRLGKPYGAVKGLAFRAAEKMRSCLCSKGFAGP